MSDPHIWPGVMANNKAGTIHLWRMGGAAFAYSQCTGHRLLPSEIQPESEGLVRCKRCFPAPGFSLGKPTCLCGFVGNTRNIREHRMACEKWIQQVRSYVTGGSA